jgi:ATP phosphoribosyltransferase
VRSKAYQVQPTQTTESERILLAVPKKGRLFERVVQLLQGAGLDFARKTRLDIAPCTRAPVTIVFLPAADIAQYVGEGEVDMGEYSLRGFF